MKLTNMDKPQIDLFNHRKCNCTFENHMNDSNSKYKSVVAEQHTAPYKIHKYFARRPWNVFQQIIEKYSKKDDIIADPFCGGGVTLYEGLRSQRKTIGFDINPLATFIIKNMVKKPFKIHQLESASIAILNFIKSLYGNSYKLKYKEKYYMIDWCELSFVAKCNYCNTENLLINECKIRNGYYKCRNLDCLSHTTKYGGFATKNCKRLGYKYLLNVANIKSKIISHSFNKEDKKLLNQHLGLLRLMIKDRKIIIPKDKIPTDWDRQFEDGLLQKGLTFFQDLFTERNLLINLLLLNYIKSFKRKLETHNYELLRIAFSSALRDTNIMSFTNKTWQSGKPTTWSKHAYWIPNQFCEVNVRWAFEKAIDRVKATLQYNSKQKYHLRYAHKFVDLKKANFMVCNRSLVDSDIPNNSVGAIITDPPYGSNVQYLELSHFWYVWNKDLYRERPDFAKEAIANRKKFVGSKSMYDYEESLYEVFVKAYRVLKYDKHMVLTFNNKDISAWLAVLLSIFRAGFSFEKNGLFFQDGIKNYRQTAHTKAKGSPYGDFIYVFKKSKGSINKQYINETEFVRDLDAVFKTYITQITQDRNRLIREMFLKAIPIIEDFCKSLLSNNKHTLYSFFKKNYMKDLYKYVES